MPAKQYHSLCFTSFKDTINTNHENIQYIAWGEETCPNTGRKHLQGYVELRKKATFIAIKKILGDPAVHLEPRKGSQTEAIKYCQKEGKFQEHGIKKQAKESKDLAGIERLLRKGLSDVEIWNEDPIGSFHAEKFIKHYRKMAKISASVDAMKELYHDAELNQFQQEWKQRLINQNNRQITWVNDPIGNSGKTFFSMYMAYHHNAFISTNAKSADIAMAYDGQEYYIMDLTRSIEGHVNYGVLEAIKNGCVFSSKYDSQMKIFKPPKVLVLSNFQPDLTKLSMDRWDIITVKQPLNFPQLHPNPNIDYEKDYDVLDEKLEQLDEHDEEEKFEIIEIDTGSQVAGSQLDQNDIGNDRLPVRRKRTPIVSRARMLKEAGLLKIAEPPKQKESLAQIINRKYPNPFSNLSGGAPRSPPPLRPPYGKRGYLLDPAGESHYTVRAGSEVIEGGEVMEMFFPNGIPHLEDE